MKWYVQVLFVSGLYNSIMLSTGVGSKLNLMGMVVCASGLLFLLGVRIREGSFKRQEKLIRRLGVFLLGGFICPQCGEAKIKVGLGYMPCISCPGCRKFFLLSTKPMRVRDMWRSVWRRRQ